MLRRIGWLAPLALVCLASLSARAQDKWVSLFDGKSLDGWEINDFSKSTKWEVVDGELRGSGGASMITSTKGPYKNFRFRAEVKINDKGNSGMYFRCKNTKPGFTDGYEAQINATHGDPIRTGSLYTMVHLYEAAHKADEWFTEEIECKDVNYRGKVVTAIKISVNGKVLFETNDFTRQFGPGYFSFQQHDPGSKVSLRKIEVMELPNTTGDK